MKIDEWRIRELVHAYNHARNGYKSLHQTLVLIGVIEGDLKIPEVKEVAIIFPTTIVNKVHEIFECDMLEKTQKNEVAMARQAAQYLFQKYTNLSQRQRSKYCGQKDHSSAAGSVKKCMDRLATEPDFRYKISLIEKEFDDVIKSKRVLN